ncbi:hypothetical protein M413DRAFT_439532 [Hebeloma cylindrosporum]|uniref:F-box domain-containing protein n=1 Tax=Hebeloma cylindrosporum TaxID=76867 RepID=A0A0C3CVG5_HEBCY|nr:hypothetical protein M413DRAFT_439532 [Hebeloma cylindrosporum h7]
MLKLPTEIYINIFQSLDFECLLICQQVCHSFREMILGSAALQYVIQLAENGQREGPCCSTWTSADRLARLASHQSSWNKLAWNREIIVPMTDGTSWELYGGVLAQTTSDGKISFHQLPSDLRCIEEEEWSVDVDMGFEIRDFSMNPSVGLLVLVEESGWLLPGSVHEQRFHLRSMKTGEPHPLAACPMLALQQKIEHENNSYDLQISGDLLTVLCTPFSAEIFELAIWHWKSGSLLLNIASEDIMSFTLLSDRWVILCISVPCINVAYECGTPSLLAVDFREETNDRKDLGDIEHCRVFRYPEFADVYNICMEIRADPGTSCAKNSGVPFALDTQTFIIVVTLCVIGMDSVIKNFVHFIPSEFLLSVVESSGGRSAAPLDWSSWGPLNTRLLATAESPSDVWVCYVYGNKFVISEEVGQYGYSGRLFDFSKRKLWNVDKDDGPGAPASINTQTLIQADENLLVDDVDSHLPYWSRPFSLENGHSHCAVLCSEDNIILVDQECKEYRVLVF